MKAVERTFEQCGRKLEVLASLAVTPRDMSFRGTAARPDSVAEQLELSHGDVGEWNGHVHTENHTRFTPRAVAQQLRLKFRNTAHSWFTF